MKIKEAIQFIKKTWIPMFTKHNILSFFKNLPKYTLIGILLFVYVIYKIIVKLVLSLYVFGLRASYGILSPCYRCSYQKSNEPVLIFSSKRGPRVILRDNEVYVRNGECIGFKKCGHCFEQLGNKDNKLDCRWNKI